MPTLTDPRGVDSSYYEPLPDRRHGGARTADHRRSADRRHDDQYLRELSDGDAAFSTMSHSATPRGDLRQLDLRGPVELRRRSSAPASGLTGRTSRATACISMQTARRPGASEYAGSRAIFRNGAFGALVGRPGPYWEIPVLRALRRCRPRMSHIWAPRCEFRFHAAPTPSASPEASSLAVGGDGLAPRTSPRYTDALRDGFGAAGDAIDVVVAPQLSVGDATCGTVARQAVRFQFSPAHRRRSFPTRPDGLRGFRGRGRQGSVGTCFYNGYAREIGEARNWVRCSAPRSSTSCYGYHPALASMEACTPCRARGDRAMRRLCTSVSAARSRASRWSRVTPSARYDLTSSGAWCRPGLCCSASLCRPYPVLNTAKGGVARPDVARHEDAAPAAILFNRANTIRPGAAFAD